MVFSSSFQTLNESLDHRLLDAFAANSDAHTRGKAVGNDGLIANSKIIRNNSNTHSALNTNKPHILKVGCGGIEHAGVATLLRSWSGLGHGGQGDDSGNDGSVLHGCDECEM
jgi:hypothetical protein